MSLRDAATKAVRLLESAGDGASAKASAMLQQALAAADPGPEQIARLTSQVAGLRTVLERIRQWDHFDVAGDGQFWKREIDTALADPGERTIYDSVTRDVTFRGQNGDGA